MINLLEVENFKSLKNVTVNCKKINLIIGEPNTGKSNLLEAIGVLSWLGYMNFFSIKSFVRMEMMADLFYAKKQWYNTIRISTGDLETTIKFSNGIYTFESKITGDPEKSRYKFDTDQQGYTSGRLSYPEVETSHKRFKFYRFSADAIMLNLQDTGYLLPPDGRNLSMIVLTNEKLREIAKNVVEHYGMKLVFVQPDNHMELQVELEEGLVASFSPKVSSDTIFRLLFSIAAIESNRNSIITLEEPEAHTFPYYTKYLAERIALDENNNQFFITTHNPYFLTSILEKAKKDEVAVHVTRFEERQTKVRTLSAEELEKMLDLGADVFFNLDKFFETS
ncbi:MAG: AAA family ATPase [Nitrososphaeria archaeon]